MLCWYHHPVSAGDQLPSCYTIGQPWNSLDRVDGFTDEAVEEPESLLFRKWIIDFAQLVTFRTTSGRLRCEATTVGTLRALEIWGGIFSGWIKRSRNFACRIQVFAFSQVWFPDSPHCSIGHDFFKARVTSCYNTNHIPPVLLVKFDDHICEWLATSIWGGILHTFGFLDVCGSLARRGFCCHQARRWKASAAVGGRHLAHHRGGTSSGLVKDESKCYAIYDQF